MTMKVTIGGGFSGDDRDYDVYDGVEFFTRYLFPRREYIADHHEFKCLAFVGKPGSGKSTEMRFITNIIRQYWNVDPKTGGMLDNVNAMITDNVLVGMENMDDRLVQLIIIDDAISKQDSRRSMSSDNVNATQQMMLIRHVAEERRRGGIVYVMFAFQDPTAIDKRFRNTCDVIFYKSYFMNSQIEQIFNGDDETVDFLKKITRGQMFNRFEYRAYSAGRTLVGDIVRVKTPFIHENDWEITRLESGTRKDSLTEELIQMLIKTGLYQIGTAATMKAYLMDLREERTDLQIFGFTDAEFGRIAARTDARVKMAAWENQKGEMARENEEKNRPVVDELAFIDEL